MTRYEKAFDYHVRGFNCCQSVIAAFADEIGMTEQECFDLGGGFGGGAGTGELCGAPLKRFPLLHVQEKIL